MKTVGSSHYLFLYIAGTPMESPHATTDNTAQSRQLPEIEQLVTLDFTVHLLQVYVRSQSSNLLVGCVRMIADMWIKERLGQKIRRYMRLNEKYQKLQDIYQELKKECKQQKTLNHN